MVRHEQVLGFFPSSVAVLRALSTEINSHATILAFSRRSGEAIPATVWSERGEGQEERTKPKSLLIKAEVL